MPDVYVDDPELEEVAWQETAPALTADEFPWRETAEQQQLVPDFTAIPVPSLFGQSGSSSKRRGKRTRQTNPFQGSLFGLN